LALLLIMQMLLLDKNLFQAEILLNSKCSIN
jgi:hypothetical protein